MISLLAAGCAASRIIDVHHARAWKIVLRDTLAFRMVNAAMTRANQKMLVAYVSAAELTLLKKLDFPCSQRVLATCARS